MDVYIDEQLDDDEEADEVGNLVIDDGQVREGPRTIFVDSLHGDFETECLNILGLMKSYNWANIANWKKFEESFESNDTELAAIVTSESALRQVHDRNFKVKELTK